MTAGALVGGVVAGVAAIGTWALLAFGWRRWRNHAHFGRLRGQYQITRKLTDQPLPERAFIEANGNVLTVEYKGLPNGRIVVGEIAMAERFPRSGEGHYSDTSSDRRLWGFWKLQVKDADTLLVHATYANHETYKLVTSGYIWSRIPASDRDA
jgi:hypothetical protein